MITHLFQNESEVALIKGITVENREDKVSISGQIDITKDKIGLADATLLFNLLSRMMMELKVLDIDGQLPDKIEVEPTVKVKNPFEN